MSQPPLPSEPFPLPLYNLGHPISHFGLPMMQNRLAPVFWSYVIETEQPKTIIEIGTHDGGFSILLAIAAKQTGARFITYDRNSFLTANTHWFNSLAIDFRRQDVFSGEVIADIALLMGSSGRSVLLCDGGDKSKEFNLFAPILKPGDIIAAHDCSKGHAYWCCHEINTADLDIASNGLQPFLAEAASQCAWACYRKES